MTDGKYIYKYLDICEKLRQHGTENVEEVAKVILQESNKDDRVAEMAKNGRWNSIGSLNSDNYDKVVRSSNAPATIKQISFLNRLGVITSKALTRKEASELISKAFEPKPVTA